MKKILVTGTNSGLGHFLATQLKADCYNRFDSLSRSYPRYDVIIHCAFNKNNNPTKSELSSYIENNIELTTRLVNNIASEKFIFISSIDVYPENEPDKHESLEININNISNIYGQSKFICESIVENNHFNHLILRCGGIIGKNKIPNSINSILTNKQTTLSKESTLNFISQQTILDIILNSIWISNEILNVGSQVPMQISEMESLINPIEYGKYLYNASNFNINKLTTIYPKLKNSTSRNILSDVLNGS